MNVFQILANYSPTLLGGLWVTIQIFLLTSVIGIIGGIALGALGARYKELGTFVRVFSFVMAGIPLLVILFWFYYPFQTMFDIQISAFTTAVIALSFFNVAAIAEIIRGVLADFPKQYIVVAKMSDLSPQQIYCLGK